MRTPVVRYRTKPERSGENQELIQKVFAELERMGATGFEYRELPPRGRHFVSSRHRLKTAKGQCRLSDVHAFRQFQAGISDRCDEQPVIVAATTIGAHGMLPDQLRPVGDPNKE